MALGAGCALLGVLMVEALQFVHLRPLSPLGWPGIGLLAGVALGDIAGLAGGAVIVAWFYSANLLQAERFPEFYASTGHAVSWFAGLAVLALVVLVVRRRFLRAAANITELAAARDELRRERERLEAALDGSSVALWDTDLRTGRVFLSDAWSEMLGGSAGETVTTVDQLIALMHADDIEAAKRASLEVMKGVRSRYAVEHRVRSRSGEWKWILSRGRVTERDPASRRALRMVGTNVDITDRRRVEEAIQSAALTDPLTGLANRVLLGERLRLACARSARTKAPFAVLYLDMDDFKQVNDALGHAAGDALLKDFGTQLRAAVRATDTVARFGGDEFVVLLEDLKAPENASRVAEKILRGCERPIPIDGRDLVARVSIGVALAQGQADGDALLRRADSALYAAKAAGRGCYRIAAA
ncbi:MAG: diguanylate cyclase domain-containing protein [Burkholderiales bacterium]